MLLKKTPWMICKRGECHYSKIGKRYSSLQICLRGVRRVFKVPCKVKWIRFLLYDKPNKDTVACTIDNDDNHTWIWIAGEYLNISDYLQPATVRRVLYGNQSDECYSDYYLACEYE